MQLLAGLFQYHPPIERLHRLNPAFEEETGRLFDQVVHVFEPESDQSFFVQARLLKEKARGESEKDGTQLPAFVQLHRHDDPRIIDPPADVLRVLDRLDSILRDSPHASHPCSVSLPLYDVGTPQELSWTENSCQQIMVPLAAILLDYPFAYCLPEADGSSSSTLLSGVELHVFDCWITAPSSKSDDRSRIMQSSCPTALGIDCEVVKKDISSLLARRMGRLGGMQSYVANVGWKTVKLDSAGL